MPLPQSSLNDTRNWDSEAIRASILDVCLQLGALDDNSLVAEWMFNDPSIDEDNSLRLQNPTTRFKEMISSECLVVPDGEGVHSERRRRRLFSFSIKAPAFTKRLSKPKGLSATNKASLLKKRPSRAAGFNRVLRDSFFNRAIDLNETNDVDKRTSNTSVVYDGGRVSTNPRTFCQPKSSIRILPQADSLPGSQAHSETHSVPNATISNDTPIHSRLIKPQILDHTIQEDDDDSDWEEIEAIPDSPLYPLPNEGMNPSVVLPLTSQTQRRSTRTIDSDLDAAVVVHDAVHRKFTLAFPRVLFRRPSKQGRHSLSSRQRRSSSFVEPTISSPKLSSVGSSSSPRKQLRINTAKTKHLRSCSGSLPPSPFVLLTSRNNDGETPTTQIVFSSETPPHPASESAIKPQTSCMGYHHQFFVQAQEEAFKTSLNSPVSPNMPMWQNR